MKISGTAVQSSMRAGLRRTEALPIEQCVGSSDRNKWDYGQVMQQSWWSCEVYCRKGKVGTAL